MGGFHVTFGDGDGSGEISSRPNPVLPDPGIIVYLRGIIPKMAQQFRLVKDDILPRSINW